MDSKQYLWGLRTALTGKMKRDELERTMTYYYDYFKELGPEKEGGLMEELGSPEELAARLLGEDPQACRPQPGPDGGGYPPQDWGPPRRRGMPLWGKVLLAIFLFPVIITVICVIFACVLGVAAGAIACVAGAIALVWAGLSVILQSGPTTVLFMGAGIFVLGLGLLIGLAAIALMKVSVLGTGHFFRWLFGRRG